MDTLPDEVFLHIVSYLNHKEICRCSLVCHRWHKICNDSSIWRSICLPFETLYKNKNVLQAIANNHSSVNSLSINHYIYDPSGPVEVDYRTWTKFEHLESLSFVSCPPCILSWFSDILYACGQTLKVLNIEGMDSFRREHFHLLLTNPRVHLRELSLSHCRYLEGMDIILFEPLDHTDTLRNFNNCLQSLELLNVDGVSDFTDSGLSRFFSACPLLKSLTIDGEHITDSTPVNIAAMLPNLEHLSISFCSSLTNKSLYSIAQLKHLKSLHLKKNDLVTSEGFEHLSKMKPSRLPSGKIVGTMKQLRLIEFHGLTDQSLVKIAESFPELNHLDISWCWHITDLGLAAVAIHCRRIETLRMVGLDAHFVSILNEPMPTLRVLDLERSSLVDDEELSRLKRAKPWIDITDYYGGKIACD